MNPFNKTKHPLLSLLGLLIMQAGSAQVGLDSSSWLNNNPAQYNPYQDQLIQGAEPMNPASDPNPNNRGINTNPVGGGIPNENFPVNNFPNPEAPGDPGPDPGIPIDGGLAILLAAGSIYGSRKVYKKFAKQSSGSTD